MMIVFIEHDIIGCTFLIIPQEDGHKFWVNIVTMVDENGTKVTQDPGYMKIKVSYYPGHMQLKCSINDIRYEEIMSCDSIKDHIIHQEYKNMVGNSNTSLYMKMPLLYTNLLTKGIGTMLWLNER